jgi:hypothetical protein
MNEKIREINKLIRRGESQYVEFKRKANHPEKIVKEVVAFANAEGGHLFIGVDDNRIPVGLKHPEDEEYILSKAIHDLCRPRVEFDVEFVQLKDDIEILHYQVFEGKRKPYFAHLEKRQRYGKAFIRVEDQSIQASYEVRQILKNKWPQGFITYEDHTRELFRYFNEHRGITLSQYAELTGMNKKLASSKLISLALSGALKIEPREGEDIFTPV